MRQISPETSPTLASLGPAHLRDATRAWWESVAADFDLEPHHVMLLTAAAEAWDRLQQAREAIARDGAFVKDRFDQLKAHPGLAVERDARIGFARAQSGLRADDRLPPTADCKPVPALMPRRVGGPARTARRLTERQVDDLLFGTPFAGAVQLFGTPFAGTAGAFDSPAARRRAWFDHRDTLMAIFETRERRNLGQKVPRRERLRRPAS